MRMIDFSNWNSILSTVIGIALFALIGIGIRVLVMFTVQQRRERMNRQINERLRVLIAAYKVLGGSFTGDLAVDPAHLRDLRQRAADEGIDPSEGSDRRRRVRDAVEGALSDILLLGTETHVRLAEQAARDLIEGRPVQTGELVRSLRDFIRQALDLEPVPAGLAIPPQGPARPAPGGGKGRGGDEKSRSGGGGGSGGAGGGAGGGGMGMGMAAGRSADDPPSGPGSAA